MKKYKTSISIVLLIALSLCSFYAFAGTVPDTSGSLPVAVNFEPNGGEMPSTLLSLEKGAALEPPTPIKEGYAFEGGYTESDYEHRFAVGTNLNAGITLYAKWTPLADLTEVTFGAYPQKRVTDADTLAVLSALSPINGYYEYNSKKYVAYEIEEVGSAVSNGYEEGGIYYFEVEDITWKILKTVGDNYILITKNIVECLPYHTTDEQVTYASSDVRSFLNGDFYDAAFNSVEKAGIITSVLTNADNSFYSTDGGDDTSDKVYLLSIDEAKNGAYFANERERTANGSDYAKARGLWINLNANFDGFSRWWLRSPGDYCFDDGLSNNNAASIDSGGYLTYVGSYITSAQLGVRPVICVEAALFSQI